MDVLRFINSRDIREHLRSIGYQFNSLEAAWLIYRCHSITLREKHEAWRELIATMPDCEVPQRRRESSLDSLHAFLLDYIKAEENALEKIAAPSVSGVYELLNLDGMTLGRFSSYEKCLEAYRKEKEADMICHEPCQIVKYMPDTDLCIEVHLSDKEEPIYVYDSQIEDQRQLFNSLWFCFPTPFKPGDILCEYSPGDEETDGYCKGPFVMTGITDEQTAGESIREAGDFSDMNAWGYFQNEDGTIYGESMWNYMDVEFYRGEFDGKRRILKALSNFLKDEIDIGLFTNAYHYVLSDEHANSLKPRGFTDEGLRLAGMK